MWSPDGPYSVQALKIVELQADNGSADGEDMGGGVRIEDDCVFDIHANMTKTFSDTVHEMLGASRGAPSSHGHVKPFKEAQLNAQGCELDRSGMDGRLKEPREKLERTEDVACADGVKDFVDAGNR